MPRPRTHFEALLYLYEIESRDLRLPCRIVRTFAGSAGHEAGIRELVAAGFWQQDSDGYTVAHHADVYRQSLAAQLAHREAEKQRQRKKRGKPRSDVGTNVGANVRATQTDRHTSSRTVGPELRVDPDGGSADQSPNGSSRPRVSRAARRDSGGTTPAPAGVEAATPLQSLRDHNGPDPVVLDVQNFSNRGTSRAQPADRNAREDRPACPVCGVRQRLRTNGKIARHGPKTTPCRGSGMTLTVAAP